LELTTDVNQTSANINQTSQPGFWATGFCHQPTSKPPASTAEWHPSASSLQQRWKVKPERLGKWSDGRQKLEVYHARSLKGGENIMAYFLGRSG